MPSGQITAFLVSSIFLGGVYASTLFTGLPRLLALIGGWPGALVAQHTLRHKSIKKSFRIVFLLTVVSNCAALVWVHTADGRVLLMTALLRIQEIVS